MDLQYENKVLDMRREWLSLSIDREDSAVVGSTNGRLRLTLACGFIPHASG